MNTEKKDPHSHYINRYEIIKGQIYEWNSDDKQYLLVSNVIFYEKRELKDMRNELVNHCYNPRFKKF